MKNKSTLLKVSLLAAILAMGSITQATAQTNTPTVSSFFTSAEQYLTSQNTNFSFANVTCEFSTGYKQVTGVNAASFVDGQYDFSNGLNLGASLQFSGVGSPVNAAQASLGYNLIRQYDTALNAELLVGYDDYKASAVVEPAVTLKKKATANTFFEIGISLPVYTKGGFNSNPTFRIGTGFTF